jgi:hypothetical protein
MESWNLLKKRTTFVLFFPLLMLLACNQLGQAISGNGPDNQQIQIGGRQLLPGKIQCEYYDLGGEGIAFHDVDSLNRGSGNLNKGDDFLSTFRLEEAVDVSFTKFHDAIDNSEFNLVQPEEGSLYVGWTEPGEWLKYTVEVQETGVYEVGIMYTANGKGQISLAVDEQDATGPIELVSTHVAAETIPWRQWHHWNYLPKIAEMKLTQGEHVLTLHTVAIGQMNYDYLSFRIK